MPQFDGRSADTGGLLERERELAEFGRALDRASLGQGGVVAVEGTAGIGKSALLREAADIAGARGARPLTARGLEIERDVAFGAARQLLEPAVRAATTEERERLFVGAATPCRQLFDGSAPAAGVAADPEFATLNALYWLIAALADAQSLVLIIDDAQWLDQPSLRLLDFLVSRIDDLPVIAVVATRPPHEQGDDAVLGRLIAHPATVTVRPAPLSISGVAKLVSSYLAGDPRPAFVEACADVTGGIPLYVSELARDLVLRGARGSDADVAAVEHIAPHKITLAMRFRGAASSEATALAHAVAVLGDGVRLDDAAALAGLERDVATAAADALVRASVLTPGAGLAFAHPIVRTAVYADLGPHERADAHARAARHLHDAGAPSGRVAAHLLRAEPAGDPWVVDALRAAGAAALTQGAPDTALRYLRRALAEPPDQASRAVVLLELGRVEAITAHPDAAAHVTEAYDSACDVEIRGEAALAGAMAIIGHGRIDDAIARLAAVTDEIARRAPDRALEFEAQLVALAMYDPVAAGQYLRRLDRIDDDIAADSTGARLMLCQLALRRLWRSHDATRAAELAERAVGDGLLLAERGTDGPEAGWTAAALTLILADRSEATHVLGAASAQARERGSPWGFGLVSALRSELAYRRGALQDAEADARAAIDVMGQAGQPTALWAWSTSSLIAALIERGGLAEAEAALAPVDAALDQLHTLPQANLLRSARGRLRLARGALRGGLRDLHECGRLNHQLAIRNPVVVPWRAGAALAHRARGELDVARQLAAAELAAARDWGTAGAIGPAQRLLGLLDTGEEQIALLHEAAATLSESPARLEHARALIDLGAALRRANRRAEAREPLSRGLDLADRCGATVLGHRAREELRAMGARPRRTRLTGLEALTASERRVAEMAAQGLGNNDIAQTLFVTRKTVEKHLGNAYLKLGVKSRAELPAHFPGLDGSDGASPWTNQPRSGATDALRPQERH